MDDLVNIGDVLYLSTIDWPGVAATIIFLRGCPLRCPHCHNRGLQTGVNLVETYLVERKVMGAKPFFDDDGITDYTPLEEAIHKATARPLVSAIVFSGGEPLMQPGAVRTLARQAKNLGLQVGVETSGYYYDELSDLIKMGLVDRVFLDIKTVLSDPEYFNATGVKNIPPRVVKSLKTCMNSGIALEVRVTVFPEGPSVSEISQIAHYISHLAKEIPENNFEYLVLQQGLPDDGEFTPVAHEDLKVIAGSIDKIIDAKIRSRPKIKIKQAFDSG